LEEAARQAGKSLEIVPVEVPRGACAFHAGETWHGSGPNRGASPRRSLVSHCLSSEARFHESNVGYIYSRYKRVDSCDMEESFFPILWREDGYRSAFLADHCLEI
jgi:ectoine hydroxylase-related dioxygenase (phytanoyl-CoA dioxygenase family)